MAALFVLHLFAHLVVHWFCAFVLDLCTYFVHFVAHRVRCKLTFLHVKYPAQGLCCTVLSWLQANRRESSDAAGRCRMGGDFHVVDGVHCAVQWQDEDWTCDNSCFHSVQV